MTQSPQKNRERLYMETAAKLLEKSWSLGQDRENPDFIVAEGDQQFGVEVCEIFTGPQNGAGSHLRREESETQKRVNALRRKWESRGGIPLIVRFVGDMCDENMADVLPELDALSLPTKPILHRDIIEVDKGPARLRVYVTRALDADWYSVNDRAGWVNPNSIDRIQNAIDRKSKKLPQYRKCAGLHNIRLLTVANRIMNSGKLSPSPQVSPALNLRGFQFVYFLSYPESVNIFD